MSQNKVYVGNLSYDSREEDLQDFFAEAGMISEVKLIKDRDTGRSKGFAFITFENSDSANNAIKLRDGSTLHERQLKVSIAKDNRGGKRDGGDRRY